MDWIAGKPWAPDILQEYKECPKAIVSHDPFLKLKVQFYPTLMTYILSWSCNSLSNKLLMCHGSGGFHLEKVMLARCGVNAWGFVWQSMTL